MSPFEITLLAIGGNTVLLAVLGILARSILSQLLAKDLKHFEIELTRQNQLAAEELKSRLSISAHEHHVRFSKLHERQAQVIDEVYALILEFEDASEALSLTNNETPENLLEFALRRAEDARHKLAHYIRRHEIFLSEGTSAKLRDLIDRVNALLRACNLNLTGKKLAEVGLEDYFPEHSGAWTSVHQYLENEAPMVRKSLELEFRKCLGSKPS